MKTIQPQAEPPAIRMTLPRAPGGISRPAPVRRPTTTRLSAMGALTVYMTLRDAMAAAGVNGMNLEVVQEEIYYFRATDGSVFMVQYYEWPRSMFSSSHRVYVAGPRQGQTEDITNAEVNAYIAEARRLYGPSQKICNISY
jgi:hypothetical protein